MKNTIEGSHIHDGHRGRMRAKLLSYGQRIFDTYELLEMLLYYVIPYKDTNPIAKRLLAAFDGLDGVFGATKEELMTVSGVGERVAEFIIKVGELDEIIGAENVSISARPYDYDTVGEHFVHLFSGMQQNAVALLLFDSSMNLIGEKLYPGINYNSGALKPKHLIDPAILSHAVIAITAQNRYFGTIYPTLQDRETTSMINNSLFEVGVTHVDHYIVTGERFFGIAKTMPQKFSQYTVIEEFFKSKQLALVNNEIEVATNE